MLADLAKFPFGNYIPMRTQDDMHIDTLNDLYIYGLKDLYPDRRKLPS